MGLTRRQLLGLAGIAAAGTAGAGAGLGLARTGRANPPGGQHAFSGTYHPVPLWRFRVSVPQDAHVTAAGSIVYVSYIDKDKMYALRTADGSVRWEAPATFTTPVTGRGLVYVIGNNGGLSALSFSNGRKQWDFPGANTAAGGPILDTSVIYTGSSQPGRSEILALDARTGRPLWQVPAVGGNGNSEVPLAVAAGALYTSTDSIVRALDRSSGIERWRWSSPAGAFAISPQVTQDIIYGGYNSIDDNNSILFALSARDGGRFWTATYPAGLFAMATVDEIVYAAAGIGGGGGRFGAGSPTVISAAAIRNGTHICKYSVNPWDLDLHPAAELRKRPKAPRDDRILTHIWTRSLANLNPTFTVIGKAALISAYPTPVSGGIVYPGGTGSETELCGLNLNNGLITWRVASAGWSLISSPVFTGEWACVGFANESIRLVHVHTGKTRWNLPMRLVSAPTAQKGMVFAVGADAVGIYGDISSEGTLYAIPI